MAARRVAVLSAMGMLLPSELRQFGDLILRPFEAVLRRTTREEALAGGQARNFALYERQGDASDDDDGSSSYGKETQLTSSIADHSHQAFAWISSKKQLGYLHLLGDMIKQLGVNIKPLLHRLLAAVLAIADNAQRRIEELSAASHDSKATATIEGDRESEYEDGDGNSDKDAMEIENEAYQDKNVLRSLRQLAVRRLGDIFALHLPGFVYTPYIECIYECVVSPRIDMLDVENTQAPSSLLGLLHVWSSYPDYLPYLTEYNQMTIPMLIRLLSAPKVHSKVISLVLDVIEAFVRVEDVAAEATPEIVALAKSTIRAQTPELLANIN
ncbi:U3 snoRNP protein, partial [Spiromyces aspiralis]